MIIQIAAIVGILFTGLKKIETSIEIEGEYIPKDEVEISGQAPAVAVKSATNSALPTAASSVFKSATPDDLRRKNIAALTALGLATAGFAFSPLNLLSLILVSYVIKDIFKIAWLALKQGKTNVCTLISITSVGVFFIPGGFFLSSLVVNLFLWSTKLANTLTQKSRQSIADIFEKTPEYVWLVIDNLELKTPYEQIKPGDILAVHAGNPIPADGVIVEGMATIDQHVLTGESQPVEKELGDRVFSSTILLSGKIHLQVERAGAETTVAKIAAILNNTVDFKSHVQMRSEQVSSTLVTPALLGGLLAMPFLGFNSALAVINSHPKEKMSVVAPISALNYLNIAVKHNILIKDGRVLELLNSVDTVVFDKTGTLTEEQPYVGAIYCLEDYHESEILAYAAAAEYKQSHPLAKAILAEAEQRGIKLPSVTDTEYTLGYGVAVMVQRRKIHVGSARFMAAENLEIPAFLFDQQAHSQEQGYTLIMVAVDGEVCGGIELLPQIRPEALNIIHYLKARGIRTCIISGDHQAPTANLAKKLDIDEYFAQVLPQDKAQIIKDLQEQGRVVCYVGDGINDSIALKQAQIAVSLSGASSIAIDTAEVILMDKGLTHLPLLFQVAEKYKKNMDMTLALMLAPAAISVGGVFLLHFGLAQSIALNMVGLAAGLGNSMLPALTHQLEKEQP